MPPFSHAIMEANWNKYEQAHPTVSARLSLETKEKLCLALKRQGISLANALQVLAGELEVKTIPLEEARKSGFEEARRLYMISYPCNVCGKPIGITSQKAKEAVSKYMTQQGWGHSQCHQTKNTQK